MNQEPCAPRRMPDADKIIWKPAFLEKYEKLTDINAFTHYSLCFLRRSIRINTLKATVDGVKKRLGAQGWKLEPTPWCKEGFFVSHPIRKDIGNLSEHALGHFYVQETASMIPALALGAKPGDIVLDLCAAPGSKTTQIAAMMQQQGVLIANDLDRSRLHALTINVERCGATNAIITHMQGKGLTSLTFDKILLDAPCSGTGTIRKSVKTIRMWNEKTGEKMAIVQKELLLAAWNLLRPGGTLVYSTCTLEPEENEAVIDFLLRRRDDAKVLPIALPLRTRGPVLSYEGVSFHEDVKHTLRLWPQDNDTEGFFVAKLQKKA